MHNSHTRHIHIHKFECFLVRTCQKKICSRDEILHQKRFWVLNIVEDQQYFDSYWYCTPWAFPWIYCYWITFVRFYWTMQLKDSLLTTFRIVFDLTILVDRCWNQTNQANTRVHALPIISRYIILLEHQTFLEIPQNCLSTNKPNQVYMYLGLF